MRPQTSHSLPFLAPIVLLRLTGGASDAGRTQAGDHSIPPGRAAVCDAHRGRPARWGGVLTATGNLKDSAELEVTVYESADRVAVPAEQLSVCCALGPQAKRSPGGTGARNATS